MSENSIAEKLKISKIFSDLTDAQLGKVAKKVQIETYTHGQSILAMNQQSAAFYVILDGAARVYLTDKNDQKRVLVILKEGDYFGEVSLFTGYGAIAHVEAFGTVELAMIEKDDMKSILEKYPEISYAVIQSLCMKLINTDKLIEDLTFKNLVGRIATKILDLEKEFGKETKEGIEIDMELTHQGLAEMVGTNRETVTKIMTFFKEDGAILFENKRLIIKDKEYLIKF